MGNSCSTDREVLEKQDVFDFRYKEDGVNDNIFQPAAREDDEETTLPSYKDHLNSVQVDPYEDRYADKGGSIFVLTRGFERV